MYNFQGSCTIKKDKRKGALVKKTLARGGRIKAKVIMEKLTKGCRVAEKLVKRIKECERDRMPRSLKINRWLVNRGARKKNTKRTRNDRSSGTRRDPEWTRCQEVYESRRKKRRAAIRIKRKFKEKGVRSERPKIQGSTTKYSSEEEKINIGKKETSVIAKKVRSTRK